MSDLLTTQTLFHRPGDPGYDAHRTPWSIAVDQRPAAVAAPTTVEEITQVVRAAAREGLRVAPQGTGHGAGPFESVDLSDVVLLRTGALRGVHIDPVRRVARVECGAQWRDVIEAAAPHGLTALHGSSPTVGVAGFCLGGGLSWYGRRHGLATNSLLAVEVVTADGEVVRADPDHHPDLFWAVRGGGGNFGVVTALEIALLPYADAYAGMMLFDLARAEEVLRTWAAFCEDGPEEITTSLRFMPFPPLPELPPFLSGRGVVLVDGASVADDATTEALLAPLRELGPEMDTFARIPAAVVTQIHMDPEDPTPAVGAGTVLRALDEAAITTLLHEVGPGAPTGLFMVDLRQLGGALARDDAAHGALGHVAGSHAVIALAMAPVPEMAEQGREAASDLVAALEPHATGGQFLNFAERAVDPATAFTPQAWERLCAVRAEVDPTGLFVGNQVVGGRRITR